MASESALPPPVRRSKPMKLSDLPSALLERVLALALRVGPASTSTQPLTCADAALEQQRSLARTLLYDLRNRRLAQHTKKVLWSTLTLPDDDVLVVHAEMMISATHGGADSIALEGSELATKVAADAQNIKSVASLYTDATIPQLVRHLHITRAECLTSGAVESRALGHSSNSSSQSALAPLENLHRQRHPAGDELSTSTWPFQPIDDGALLHLVSKLISLSSFEWAASRHPPRMLCSTLGASSKSLTSFKFDLTEAIDAREPTSTSPTTVNSPSRAVSTSATNLSAGRIQRWDAPELSALPLSLTHLALSFLSQVGAQELAAALPSLPALDHLELGKSVYIDDPLLAEVGKHVPRLKRLRLYNLPGSKLTEVGLGDVLDGCSTLESLELCCVEGRLSKSTWSKVSPLPESLKTLVLLYHELPSPPHKSWVLDHLSSLAMALEFSSLQSLIISRKVEDVVRLPGQHWTSIHPIDPVLAPRPLPTAFVDAIASRGRAWKDLNLDLWQIDGHALKKVLSACTNLTTLQVMYDESLRNLLGLSSAFAVAHQLRNFAVSIDPAHVPALSPGHPLSPSQSPTFTVCPLPFGSTSETQVTPPRAHHGRRSSVSSTTSRISLLPDQLGAIAPSTKDWRRFLKKTLALESVEWTGRGGLGTWFFERTSTLSSSIKVDFEPSAFYAKTLVEVGEGVDLLTGVEGVDPVLRGLMRRSAQVDAPETVNSVSRAPLPALDEAGSSGFSNVAKRSLGSSISDGDTVSDPRSSTPPIGTWTSRSHIEHQKAWDSSTSDDPPTPPGDSPSGLSHLIDPSLTPSEGLGTGEPSTDVAPSTNSKGEPKRSWSEFVMNPGVGPVQSRKMTSTKLGEGSHSPKERPQPIGVSSSVSKTPSTPVASPKPTSTSAPAPSPTTAKTFSSIVGGGGPTKVVNTRSNTGTGPRGSPRTSQDGVPSGRKPAQTSRGGGHGATQARSTK
ncbi:BZ3500_MvSof-1268-A1-R1_Chr1-1g00832 [Microbotryum saponariae]|uniref:BZ3500_MvSof-1268-A1-R1_Chr1-1g00832 protein n=1 Tax=Microbotryum saponariae TaxID=289078 RepID=A0A2X0K8G8_9BASI|nr:BZ3500_MvSof-1268-A1-R1_Chr1-1g00832 [Microbotryum saponariae]SCZ92754.1 BZ3501_MvSof-1269-A2-R1_Chr1-1g00429 [Microbotryum saponariae]